MQKTISSKQTFLMKIIFPLIWIPFFGIGAIGAVFNAKINTDFSALYFIFLWLAGSAFIYWSCIRLKKVSVSGDFLYISNYFKEIQIPLSNIEKITENIWINIHPVTIHLRHSSEFGKKIVFMPTLRFFAFFSAHPIVSELENLVSSKNYH